MASSLIASNSYGYIPVTLTMTQRLTCMFLGWQHQILITMKVKLIVSSFACFDWQYNSFITKKDSTECYLCCYTNSLRTEELWLTRWLFKLSYRLSTHTCPINVCMNGISTYPAVALSRSLNWLSTRNWRQDLSRCVCEWIGRPTPTSQLLHETRTTADVSGLEIGSHWKNLVRLMVARTYKCNLSTTPVKAVVKSHSDKPEHSPLVIYVLMRSEWDKGQVLQWSVMRQR